MTENANDRFERLAAAFRAETGMLAPGKDDPTNTHDYETRRNAWLAWLATPKATENRT